jgi:hypothetical protein
MLLTKKIQNLNNDRDKKINWEIKNLYLSLAPILQSKLDKK